MLKGWTLVCAVALLCACSASQSRRPPSGAPAPPPGPTAGIGTYTIDGARSELKVFVHRAGPMARLGHNHVIVNRRLSGWANVGADPYAAFLVLRIPAADFAVDDARERWVAGSDFAEPVGEDAKAGTRRNMLSSAVLDAARFSTITLTSIAMRPAEGREPLPPRSPAALIATLALDVAGHRSTLTVPFELEVLPGGLAASGRALLRQSEMGIAPFSVMFGALQVQDELEVQFRLVAAR